MKKLILRLLDIKDPETMEIEEIKALVKRKHPGWHVHHDPRTKAEAAQKPRPPLLAAGQFHD